MSILPLYPLCREEHPIFSLYRTLMDDARFVSHTHLIIYPRPNEERPSLGVLLLFFALLRSFLDIVCIH